MISQEVQVVLNQSIPTLSLCSCVKSGSKCNVIWDGEKGIINEFLGIFAMQHILREELTFVSHGSRSHNDSHDSLACWLTVCQDPFIDHLLGLYMDNMMCK